jgi:hypothetical protein
MKHKRISYENRVLIELGLSEGWSQQKLHFFLDNLGEKGEGHPTAFPFPV